MAPATSKLQITPSTFGPYPRMRSTDPAVPRHHLRTTTPPPSISGSPADPLPRVFTINPANPPQRPPLESLEEFIAYLRDNRSSPKVPCSRASASSSAAPPEIYQFSGPHRRNGPQRNVNVNHLVGPRGPPTYSAPRVHPRRSAHEVFTSAAQSLTSVLSARHGKSTGRTPSARPSAASSMTSSTGGMSVWGWGKYSVSVSEASLLGNPPCRRDYRAADTRHPDFHAPPDTRSRLPCPAIMTLTEYADRCPNPLDPYIKDPHSKHSLRRDVRRCDPRRCVGMTDAQKAAYMYAEYDGPIDWTDETWRFKMRRWIEGLPLLSSSSSSGSGKASSVDLSDLMMVHGNDDDEAWESISVRVERVKRREEWERVERAEEERLALHRCPRVVRV
ncbi:MAG: hypothetical protein M1817_005153 [Caeruleum heppii]|nr:MAG: hypothetical protein M1817_005153 [Caeruleum heppii]